MIKMIATDLDGTLLSSVGEVSEQNAQAIKAAQKAGIEVVIATGRSYYSAYRPINKAGLKCPIICLNGANIYTVDGQMTRNIKMEKAVTQKILHTVKKENAYFELYTNKGVYSMDRSNFMDVLVNIMLSAHPEATEEEIKKRAEQRFQEENFIFTKDFQTVLDDEEVDIYKALAFSLEADGLERIKAPFLKSNDVTVTSSGFDNAEFNHPNAQKGIALTLLAEDRGLELSEVMAIGDNYNDVSMLEIVGRSVAMGNAEAGVKKRCHYTTTSNDQDGVAKAIKEIL
ncbi:HAD family hydrolase [Amphibacillus cookii]|uniref:HAD family hydrolase n=1 Tax=Amphibacillus cookii TaxID=767787 RepID=UPI00195807BA|nr:HAD family hydrolase [Amphibacillus cookii]MBM7540343.1 Cof subfamily protein (haloacid dehalogenase superfamily) [Amphibacillus cookii]